MRARLPGVFGEFVMFVFKQAWVCLFGGLLLAMIIGTKLVWNSSPSSSRSTSCGPPRPSVNTLPYQTSLKINHMCHEVK